MTIFISYAHYDKAHVEGFLRHIHSLRAADERFQPISDHKIPPGSDWGEWLDQQIGDAEGGILLVSEAFLNSRWCEEEASALYRRLEPERIFPVLLRSCAWKKVEWLSRYQFVNTEPAVAEGTDIDRRWSEIVEKIWEARQSWTDTNGQTDPSSRGESPKEFGMHSLKEALSSEEGGLAFFLGPGIHEMQGDAPAASYIQARFALLERQLREEGPLRYARAIVEDKLPGALKTDASVSTPEEKWRQDLVAFQASLAQLGSFASELVAEKMTQRHTALANISSLVISLEEEDEGLDQIEKRTTLRNLLFKACYKIAALWDSPSPISKSNDLGLGVQGILEQMMALTYVTFGRDLANSQDEECQNWLGLFKDKLYGTTQQQIRQLRSDPPRRFLALTHLEWLGDLLWHTLRFDTPIYPTPSDLAFQLSVCAPLFTPPRRENIGTIAPLALPALHGAVGSLEEVRSQVDQVKTWLETSATVDPHQIYRAVARALCDAWRRRESPTEPLNRNIPLAVTTNFDNEIESILSKAQISHHILFPVHYCRRTTQDFGAGLPADHQQEWVLYTESWAEDDDLPDRSWSILEGQELQALEFEGPLLVKLFGSPLTKLHEKRVIVKGQENKSGRFEFAHRLIVSDLELLAVMVQDWWPKGLASLLFEQHNRLICFLGYSPVDVDNRLRLFEHVHRQEAPKAAPVVVMSPPEDPIYSKYLLQMKTHALPEGLDKICALIDQCCKCDGLGELRSEK